MKKNIFICSLGILLVIYSVIISSATLFSAIAAILGSVLVVYSLKGKIKRSLVKTKITPFV